MTPPKGNLVTAPPGRPAVPARHDRHDRDPDVPPAPGGNGHAAHAPDDAGHGHDEEIDLNVPEPRPAWLVAAAAAVVVVLAVLLVVGFVPRHRQQKELTADASDAANPRVAVNVARPKPAPADVEIPIPASLKPWQEVSLYARTTGYLRKYYVDISSEVTPGMLMAEIDTPEVDQELRQSQERVKQTQAALVTATTNRDLAKTTWDRYKQLRGPNYVSEQEAQERESAYKAAEANLNQATANVGAAEADVQRLTEMKGFANVTAPFAGVVSGRGYDNGSLITANPTSTDIKPLFRIAQNDALRAFINVPQSAALDILKGMNVKLTAAERPGRVFTGKVLGTTNYLDPVTRTLLTQVKVQNERGPDGQWALLPGMYVTVTFAVHRNVPPLIVPAPALVTNAGGTQVAVVRGDDAKGGGNGGGDGTAHFQPVKLGRDFGTEVEVVEGLSPDDRVITNPGERLAEGVAVRTSGGADNAGQPQGQATAAGAAPAPPPATQPAEKVAEAAHGGK